MIKSALPSVAAIFALCVSLSAQESTSSNVSKSPSLTLVRASPSTMVQESVTLKRTGSFGALNNLWYGRGPLTIGDGRLFSFPGTFGWVEGTPGDILPYFTPEAPLNVNPENTLAREPGPKSFDLFRKPDYAGGEVGFFFGKSIGGKYSRQVEAGYILGQIIEGNTQITVGASYGHESGKAPRVIGR